MDLTPKQQTSEAIRQADTILVLTGQHPSIDQATAVIALTMILQKFGKQVNAVISDNIPQATQILETRLVERSLGGLRDFVLKVDTSKAEVAGLHSEMVEGKLNVYVTPSKGNFAPSDVTFDYGASHLQYDLAIVLGVPTRARIDRLYEQNQAMFSQIPLINLDFHRSNESYGAVNLIEPNASSLCEMLVALSESLQGGIIDAEIATVLFMGIVGSTDRFTATHTTSKSLTVAAQMMAAGARQQAVIKALYRDSGGRGEGRNDNQRSEKQNHDRSAQREQRSNQHNNQSAQQQVASRPEAATRIQAEPVVSQASVVPTSASQMAAPQPAPARVQGGSLPIIEPSHIEMMAPSAQTADALATSAPVSQAPQPVSQPAAQVQPAAQPLPMADYATTMQTTQVDTRS